MRKIVITGATSFIGIHLIKEWLKFECQIWAICRPNSDKLNRIPNNVNVQIVECSMDEYNLLSNIILKADYFYHLAWEGARVPQRDDEEIQQRNYVCSLKAIEAAITMGCSVFVGAGSQAEYGIINEMIDESSPCNPNTVYGKKKLQACKDLEHIAEKTKIRFIWTRIFSVYGKYDFSGTLVMSAIEKMKNNLPMNMTECSQLWDYLYVEDAARAMRILAECQSAEGIFNLASGECKPLREFVKVIKDVLGSESELNFGSIPYGTNEPINLIPCINKLTSMVDWKRKVTFEQGIKEIIEK